MQFHEVANIFPMMSAEEFGALKADIQANGQQEPIWTHDSQIIDGRNRYKACSDLGVMPKIREWRGNGSLVSFVISLNLKRRHLSSSQQAAVAAEALPFYEQEAKERQRQSGGDKKSSVAKKSVEEKIPQPTRGKATKQAAKAVGANHQYISDAKKLKDTAPILFEAVKQDVINIPGAKALAKLDKDNQQVALTLIKNGEVKTAKQARQQIKQAAARDRAASLPTSHLWTITDAEDVIKCDALITDPPYGILNESWEPEHLERFTREWAERWNGCGADLCLIFWSQKYLLAGRQWFDENLSNYSFQQWLIWHYPNNNKPQGRARFKLTWEPIFFYRRKDSEKQILVDDISGEWGKDQTDFDCHVANVPQSDFSDAECKEHPAQKPVSVMRWLVGATTRPGDLVCDPFTGSGTTGIATTQLKRRFHGIETSAEYREIAEKRIKLYGNEAALARAA